MTLLVALAYVAYFLFVYYVFFPAMLGGFVKTALWLADFLDSHPRALALLTRKG